MEPSSKEELLRVAETLGYEIPEADCEEYAVLLERAKGVFETVSAMEGKDHHAGLAVIDVPPTPLLTQVVFTTRTSARMLTTRNPQTTRRRRTWRRRRV